MATAVFKIMLYFFCCNLGVGLLFGLMPSIMEKYSPLSYDSTLSKNLDESAKNASINPSAALQSPTSSFFRLMDVAQIGSLGRVWEFFNMILFGFPIMIGKVFGLPLDSFIIIMLKTLTTVGYFFGFFFLWTGRDIGRS